MCIRDRLKAVDQATPPLVDRCARGARIASGEVRVALGGGTLSIEFEQGLVTSIGREIDASYDVGHELLSIVAERYTISFTPEGEATVAASVHAGRTGRE